MELDHVLVAVADLATAAREIEEQYGLVLLEGGRHPGWGTANRIVPLGESYVELVAVVDPAEAAESAFGRWVSEAQPQLAQPLGWAVRTHELDHVAKDSLAGGPERTMLATAGSPSFTTIGRAGPPSHSARQSASPWTLRGRSACAQNGQSGMLPCLRAGRGSRFVRAVSSAPISTGRVRRGSITSST